MTSLASGYITAFIWSQLTQYRRDRGGKLEVESLQRFTPVWGVTRSNPKEEIILEVRRRFDKLSTYISCYLSLQCASLLHGVVCLPWWPNSLVPVVSKNNADSDNRFLLFFSCSWSTVCTTRGPTDPKFFPTYGRVTKRKIYAVNSYTCSETCNTALFETKSLTFLLVNISLPLFLPLFYDNIVIISVFPRIKHTIGCLISREVQCVAVM